MRDIQLKEGFDLLRKTIDFGLDILLDPMNPKNNVKEEDDPVKLMCLYLAVKSLFLSDSILLLVENSQIHSSSYLVRGVIECRADINYLIKTGDKQIAEKFFEAGNKIRESLMDLENSKNFPTLNGIWTSEKISNRVKLLGDHAKYAYQYFCCFTHSTPIGMDVAIKQEHKKCVIEQIMIDSDMLLGILKIIINTYYPEEKDKLNNLCLNFINIFVKPCQN